LEALQSEMAQLIDEISVLQTTAENQRRLLEKFAPEDTQQLVKDRNNAIAARDRAQLDHDRLLQEIATNLAEAAKTNAEVDGLVADADALEQELTSAKAAARNDRNARTRASRTPIVRQTFKRQAGIILKYGRMYVWHEYDRNGERLGLNINDFVVVSEDEDGILTAPRPNGGVPLDDSAASRTAIRARLGRFDPSRFYFLAVVSPDSFEAFHRLRDEIVAMGFEYAIMPKADGSPISDRGGTDRPVQ
jgi:hypothetical protein